MSAKRMSPMHLPGVGHRFQVLLPDLISRPGLPIADEAVERAERLAPEDDRRDAIVERSFSGGSRAIGGRCIEPQGRIVHREGEDRLFGIGCLAGVAWHVGLKVNEWALD